MATDKKAQPIHEENKQAHEVELTTASGQMRIIAENLREIAANFGALERELANMNALDYIQFNVDIKETLKALKYLSRALSDYEYVFAMPEEEAAE